MSEHKPTATQFCVELLLQGGTLNDLPKIKLPTVSDVLNEHIGKSNMPIRTIAELSGINNSTIHRILNDEMNPTRNTLLRLAFIMEMSFEETQVLLKAGNRSLLSASRTRDLIIMQGIIQKRFLGDVNDTLTDQGFHDLFSKQD